MKGSNRGLRLLLGSTLFMLMLGVLACSSGYGSTSTKTTTTSGQPASGNAVTISNYSFSPSSLTVAKGTTVTWTNRDSVTHTVTNDSGAFNSGNLAPNANFSHTFNSAGTFAYHCSIHTYMTGTIIVQ